MRNSEKCKKIFCYKHADFFKNIINEKQWEVVRSSGECNKSFSDKHADILLSFD